MAWRLNTSLSPGRRCLSWGSKSLNSEGKKAHVHMQSSMLLNTGKAIIEFLTGVHTQLSMLLYTGKAIIVSSFFFINQILYSSSWLAKILLSDE